jgi:hypothetical protein
MCAGCSIRLNFNFIQSGRVLYLVYADVILNILWEWTIIKNFTIICLAYVLDIESNNAAISEVWGGYGFVDW